VIDAGQAGSIVLGLMATDALGGGATERSISYLEVALGAGQKRMASDQREIGSPVGVSGEERLPPGFLVAALAALAQHSAVRIAMTGGAQRGQGRLEILAVAGFAIGPLMDAFERESGRRVIERRCRPGRRRVTDLALGVGAGAGRRRGEDGAPAEVKALARSAG
jgi:hypothetical protein